MEKANGRKFQQPKIATTTRASTNLTRKMVMGCSLGKVVTSTKATTRRMKERATEKCTG